MPRLGLLLVFGAPLTHAQQAIIDRCKQTSSDADRIACLEAAILGRQSRGDDPPAETQADPPRMAPGPGPEEDAAVAPAPPGAGRAADSASDPVARPGQEEAGSAGLGAEQVIARQQTRPDGRREPRQARGLRVASYDTVPFERLVVTLENGQVWRQIKGDTQRIRVDLSRNQTVDISEASVSGYKLRLNELRRTIRVERVR